MLVEADVLGVDGSPYDVIADLVAGDGIALLQLEPREQGGAVGGVHHRLLGVAERVGALEVGDVLGPPVHQAQHADDARPGGESGGEQREEEHPCEGMGARLPLFAPILHD